MAAPATTTRLTPVGIKLRDGFRTLISCSLDPDISFWEKTVKPPGMDGGEKVEQTTMHNLSFRTFEPRCLLTVTQGGATVAYDPDVFNQLAALMNRPTSWTIRFRDNSTLDFFGFLKMFDPDDLEEGKQPTAKIQIEPTNEDPATFAEQGFVMTAVSGS